MPLKDAAKKVMSSMKDTYDSEEEAEKVFHATANKQGRNHKTWKKKAKKDLKEHVQRHAHGESEFKDRHGLMPDSDFPFVRTKIS